MSEKSNDKTCGECKFNGVDCRCEADEKACGEFVQKTITNGDVIRQGGNRALAEFKSEHKCDTCAYAAPLDHAPACQRPEGRSCFDGMLEWLNAPAESEGEDE